MTLLISNTIAAPSVIFAAFVIISAFGFSPAHAWNGSSFMQCSREYLMTSKMLIAVVDGATVDERDPGARTARANLRELGGFDTIELLFRDYGQCTFARRLFAKPRGPDPLRLCNLKGIGIWSVLTDLKEGRSVNDIASEVEARVLEPIKLTVDRPRNYQHVC